jgi:hypothetical protein
MKLSQLASSATTSVELKHPQTGEPTGVVISGHTPDSKEWKDAVKRINGPVAKQNLVIGKGTNHIEIDGSGTREKTTQLLSEMVTGIDGLDDFKYTPEGITKMFENPIYAWIMEQWGSHTDDRKNFFTKPVKPASST